MQIIQYNIAGIDIELKIPFECVEQEKFKAFRCLEDNNGERNCTELKVGSHCVDISVEFVVCQHALENKGKQIYSSDIYVFRNENRICIEHFISFYEKPYAWLVWDKDKPNRMTCFILEESVEQCKNMGHLFQLIRLEQICMAMDAVILHTSFIKWRGKGILFTAPSGTGKSTQAELWRQYQGAEIINGDRAILRKCSDQSMNKDRIGLKKYSAQSMNKDSAVLNKHTGKSAEQWTASGLPYAGSSNIFRNESCEIGAIVVLRQGKRNEIQKLRPVEAFKSLYSEVIIRRWDEQFQNNLIELLTDMALNVPVYMLKCLPDEGAVNVLKDYLEKEK